MRHRTALFLGLASIAFAAPTSASAALHVRADSGADDVAITDVRDAVRADIGGGTTAAGGGLFGGLRREINWDGVPDANSAPNPFPGNFFNARGAEFSTPGTGFEVSSNLASGVPVEFGNVDAAFTTQFRTFSAQRLFRAVGSNVTTVDFFVPGTKDPATTTGFGVIFSDVELVGSTKLEALDVSGKVVATVYAPPAANEGLSIASIVADDGPSIAKVRITSGTAGLAAGLVDSATTDIVVMDDFLYGEPVAMSNLAVDVTAAPEPATVGANLTYTATVRNDGKGNAPAADLTAWLPAGVAALSATPSQGTCSTPTTCALGALAPGASATVTLVAKPTAPGQAVALFTVHAPNDGVPTNDTKSVTSTVNDVAPAPPADTTAPKVTIASAQITVAKNGNALMKIGCPKTETRCKGSVRLVTNVVRLGGRKLKLELGSGKFTADGGKTATVTIKLGLAERALLKAVGSLKATATVSVEDAAGNDGTLTKPVTLKAAKK